MEEENIPQENSETTKNNSQPDNESVLIDPPEEKTGFLNQLALASWAFPGIEPDQESVHCLYKRKNFYAFINSNDASADQLYKDEKSTIEKELSDHIAYLEKITGEITDRYNEKINSAKEKIDTEKSKLEVIRTDRQALQDLLKDYEKERLQLITQKLDAVYQKALAHEDVLGKWVEEIREKIEKVKALSDSIIKDKQDEFNRTFNAKADVQKDIVSRLKESMNQATRQLSEVNKLLGRFSREGITIKLSKRIFRTGSLLALAAGWLFSIFVSAINLSNNDVFSYLFKELGSIANGIPGNLYEKIGYWFVLLVIITLVSLLFRSGRVLLKRKTKTRSKDSEFDSLFIRISADNLTYTTKTRAQGWSFFWMRSAPRLFVFGILLILLSFYSGYNDRFSALNTSLFGLAVGSAIVFAIGGILYLYIVKVIEPRYLDDEDQKHDRWWKQSELLLAILFLLGSLLYLYLSPINLVNDSRSHITVSLLLFLTLSLVAGLLLGYGIRYESLLLRKEELEEYIDECNGNMLRYSGPMSIYSPKEFYESVNSLILGLYKKIEDRNNALLKRKKNFIPFFGKKKGLGNDTDDKGKNSWKTWMIWGILYGLYQSIKIFFSELFFASENTNAKTDNSRSRGYYMTDDETWDSDFFVAHDEKIKALDQQVEEKDKRIAEVKKNISDLDDNRSNPLARINWEITLWTNRITNWQADCNRISLVCEKGKANLTQRKNIAIRQVEEAYELSRIYKQHLQNRIA